MCEVATRDRRDEASLMASAPTTLGLMAVWTAFLICVSCGVACGSPAQHWTVRDIVQIKRIEGTAVLGSSRVAGYIVEAPTLADDRNHYALYKVSPGRAPALLVKAAFMRNLEWRPGTMDWTMRADFGNGVQLYQVTEAGLVRPLFAIKPVVLVGGYDGLISGDETEPRETGVLSYQWAPDGRHFWYSRVRLRSDVQVQALSHGIVYNDATMTGLMPPDFRRQIHYARSELHVVDVRTGIDRVVASDSLPVVNGFNLRYDYGSVQWVDSSTLQYRVLSLPNGYWTNTLWRFDLLSGKVRRLSMPHSDPARMVMSLPVPKGFVTWRKIRGGERLEEVTTGGKVLRDFGPAHFRFLSPSGLFRGGMWKDRDEHHWIFAVAHQDDVADGLDFFPSTAADRRIQNVAYSLNDCAFNTTLSWGVCNRESLTQPPELVCVSPSTGEIRVVARPDALYENIIPLESVAMHWRNRFGYDNTGYITYPRGYIAGRAYPAVVVTHSIDAANFFAWDGFQWEFPIQVFAEEGYLVLSVNEPMPTPHAAPPPFVKEAADSSRAALWFSNFIDPMSSLGAAVESLIKAGQVNPAEVGLCGYSRGEELSSFIMTHSRIFGAASFGDDTLYNAGDYWTGELFARRKYDSMFGGSPFDPKAFQNYLRYSPSARAPEFAGPVLQQDSGYVARQAIELTELLLEARIPTELVSYPHEAHIFYGPRDRALAMRRNLDWFDYWLRGLRDPHAADPGEYARWDVMASRWADCKAACRAKLGLSAHSTRHRLESGSHSDNVGRAGQSRG